VLKSLNKEEFQRKHWHWLCANSWFGCSTCLFLFNNK